MRYYLCKKFGLSIDLTLESRIGKKVKIIFLLENLL